MTSTGQSRGAGVDTASAELQRAARASACAHASWKKPPPFPGQHSAVPFGSASLPTFPCQQQEGWEGQSSGLGKDGACLLKLQM